MSDEDAFPDIGALAPLGDGRSAALVGPDAAIEFFCPLRFDAPALVFPLLVCFVNCLSAVSAVRIRPVGLGFLPFERWSIS